MWGEEEGRLWAGRLLCFQHHILLWSSEETEISKSEPDLPVGFNVTFNLEGIQNLFHLAIY